MGSKIKVHGFWGKLDLFPPPFIYLYAAERSKGKVSLLSDEEISLRSAIPVSRINQIIWERSWDKIPVGEMKAFVKGCGCDFGDPDTASLMTRALNQGYTFPHRLRDRTPGAQAKYASLLKRLA